TGGYAYDREILARLPNLGFRVRHLQLPGGYPEPSSDDLARTRALFAELDPTNVLLVDGLAFGAMPEEIIRDVRVPIIALVHHPLGYEPGLPEERAEQLIASERAALKFARRVIVTSPFTKRLLTQEFEVPPNLITVAMPGTAPAERRLDQPPEGLSDSGRGSGSPFGIGLAADHRGAAGSGQSGIR